MYEFITLTYKTIKLYHVKVGGLIMKKISGLSVSSFIDTFSPFLNCDYFPLNTTVCLQKFFKLIILIHRIFQFKEGMPQYLLK